MTFYLEKNDKRAYWLIGIFTVVVFVLVSILARVQLNVNVGFDVHIFAKANAVINTIVSILLVAGLLTAKQRFYTIHRNIMLSAMVLSILFLASYITHHLLSGETYYGDVNGDHILSAEERDIIGGTLWVYRVLLGTHILLAGIVLPFILLSAYRALINENARHRKIAKITWPIWFYVSVTGPIVYLMISHYYH